MTDAESTEPISSTMPSAGRRSRQGGTLDLSSLVGRARELELLAAAIASASAGRARRVLLVGEPGIGKSALLDAAVQEAPEARVAWVTGLETEEELAFGVLLALVRPFVDRLDRLPESQRIALESALELGRAEPSSRFAVSAATLALVAAVAEESPLVLVLDDVQWIDAASLSAVSFACARLDADAVAVLAAARPGGAELLAGARFDVVHVGPLSDIEAAEVVAGLEFELAPEVCRRVVSAAHGNPLALIELTTGLTEAQRAGRDPLPANLPTSGALERAFAAGVSRLPPPTRTALLVAALGAAVSSAELGAALAAAGVSWFDLMPAEAAGLIDVRGGTFVFRHPLVRTAVVGSAGGAELRRAHAALAEALPAGELRTRHRAAAALGADPAVAQELEEAARAASGRGAPAAAVSLLLQAAELSDDLRDVARRQLAAAEAAWLAGQISLARSLSEQVLDTAPDNAARARALHLRGRVAHQTEPAARARELLLEAASLVDVVERREVVEILADAVGSCFYAGDLRRALELAEELSGAAAADGGVEEFLSSLLLGTALFLNGRGGEGEALVRKAVELVQRVDVLRDEPRHLGLAAMAPGWIDEPELGRQLADRAVARARELGAFNSLPTSLKFRAWADFDLGHWDAALANASEAVGIAREIGQASQLCANLGIVAAVLAGRGDEEGCTAAVDEALLLADELGLDWHRSGLLGWRGLLELGLGKPTAALTLEAAVGVLDRLGNRNAGEHPRIDLVEALVRAGRLAEARVLLDGYEAMARRDGLPYALGSASRLRGLVAPDGEYAAPFERALELLEREVFARARTHLCFGERLRRSGERRRARAELEMALELFERLGAEPWAERCRQELVASGRRLRRIHASNRNELTPQELQVALQVARGLTNREIAQALFLSPKTVEFHLTRIYRKLGLHARAELIERYVDQVRGG